MSTSTCAEVLDAFCGMGGLSWGFREAGFRTCGVDISEQCGLAYLHNRLGEFVRGDLTKFVPEGRWEVIVGGPPCEPWSLLNLTKRGSAHPKAGCLDAFFRMVRMLRPKVFVLENVVALKSCSSFQKNLQKLEGWYEISCQTVRYSDYGAATSRRRLFCLGTHRRSGLESWEIFQSIRRQKPKSVRDAIWDLRRRAWDPATNHVWSKPRTVRRYSRYYVTRRFGWYALRWNLPAPSFGNITKTYILHPDSLNGGELRPISVREAMRIMGFPDSHRFPPGLPLVAMYQMVADSVSPVFSKALAGAIRRHL